MKFFGSLLAIIITWGSTQAARGQAAPSAGNADMQVNINSLIQGLPAALPNANPETKGSPYAIARWLPAHLTLHNNVALTPVPLKYDVLNQRLLMRRDFKSPDSLQLQDNLVARFTLDEPATALAPARARLFQRFTDAPDPRSRSAYVEVLHEGRFGLLKQYIKVLHRADLKSAYGNGNQYDEVEDKQLYFLRRPDASVVPVKLTLKSLLDAAPELAPKLKQAAATAKTEADWATALHMADPR
jgi:hypothetical protein